VDLTALSMTRMAQMIAAREVSAEELMRAHVALAERLNPRLNAIIELDGDAALDAAREADRRRPRDEEPFFGVPMTSQHGGYGGP
jgi:Asp-tRNA(Asn)/Glu-tRNA(Gln) amidotransferase A subunit family amidase